MTMPQLKIEQATYILELASEDTSCDILNYLSENFEVAVSDLIIATGWDGETIRQQLSHLENVGLVRTLERNYNRYYRLDYHSLQKMNRLIKVLQ